MTTAILTRPATSEDVAFAWDERVALEAESDSVADAAPPGVETAFADLTQEWLEETAYSSSPTAITTHPAYLRIIGLGPDVVPIILRELSVRPGHWFVALEALTGTNPVREADYGDLPAMSDAWIDWARGQGYLS